VSKKMGILDPKTRFIDTVITNEGRRQIANGKLKAEFYSFSDSGAVYSKEDVYASGSGLRQFFGSIVNFETNGTMQDSITLESDDSGLLTVNEIRRLSGSDVKIVNGQFFSGSVYSSMSAITDVNTLNSITTTLLSSSLDNFKDLSILRSPDFFDANVSNMLLSNQNFGFTILDDKPILSQKNGGMQEAKINNIESLFCDKRLSHLPNFQFLPPVNKPKKGTNKTQPIGTYVRLNQPPIEKFEELENEIENARANGFAEDILFTETSYQNRLFGQMFEVSSDGVRKLDVIDFGIFTSSGKELTESERIAAEEFGQLSFTKHVFFVGKVFEDDNRSHTFVNMFTLIFS